MLHVSSRSLAVGHANGYILYRTADALESTVLLDDADNSAGQSVSQCLLVYLLFSGAGQLLVHKQWGSLNSER